MDRAGQSVSGRKRQAAFALAIAAAVSAASSLALAADKPRAPIPLPYYEGPAPGEAHDLGGVWQASSYDAHFRPLDGSKVPFTPEGLAAFKANAKAIKTEPAKNNCLPLGTPRSYLSAFPIMILQAPATLTIVHEQNRTFRQIRLDRAHEDPKVWDPSFVGEAVAKWDGDTLVVDTVNFNGMIWLDDAGLPASDQLHEIDRWRRIDGGKKLEVTFTIDDPKMYSHTWQARRVFDWRPDVELLDDWVCGAGHRSIAKVKGAKSLYLPKTQGLSVQLREEAGN